jgi:hypothetical protein
MRTRWRHEVFETWQEQEHYVFKSEVWPRASMDMVAIHENHDSAAAARRVECTCLPTLFRPSVPKSL